MPLPFVIISYTLHPHSSKLDASPDRRSPPYTPIIFRRIARDFFRGTYVRTQFAESIHLTTENWYSQLCCRLYESTARCQLANVVAPHGVGTSQQKGIVYRQITHGCSTLGMKDQCCWRSGAALGRCTQLYKASRFCRHSVEQGRCRADSKTLVDLNKTNN